MLLAAASRGVAGPTPDEDEPASTASAAHEGETVKATATAHSATNLVATGTSRGDAVPVSQATESEKP